MSKVQPFLWLVLSGALVLGDGCGSPALTIPQGIPVKAYPANEPLRLTLVMTHCSDVCAVYSDSECTVAVDGKTLELDIRVPYERDDSQLCAEGCGREVLAHCSIEALGPGTYVVSSGAFEGEITVR